jgi:hypothetical protein
MSNGLNGTPTLLSSEPSEEEKAQMEHRKREIDRLGLVVDCWIDGYQRGEVSLEGVARGALAAARHFAVSRQAEEVWVGRAVRRALDRPPAREGRSNGVPSSFKKVAAYLVDRVTENESVSRSPSRHEPNGVSVYERVAEIFRNSGYARATARMVEKWSADYPETGESVGGPISNKD